MSEWAWLTNTKPFSAIGNKAGPARFVVEQVEDKWFAIPTGQGFQYNGTSDSSSPIVVDGTSLGETDFASIPPYMSWFVSRYGRHTPAALVHDQLVQPKMPTSARKDADTLFLAMLDALEVPPVRSRVMWAAVTLATRAGGSVVSKLGLALWGVAAAGGIALLVYGLATFTAWAIIVALVGPAVGSVLWGSQIRAGLIAGYALPVVVLPALASVLGYWTYWIVESAVRRLRKISQGRGADPPKPVGFRER